MPDYGGVLEIPGSDIKQHGLNRGLPFSKSPLNVEIATENDKYLKRMNVKPQLRVPDCIIITHLFPSESDGAFTIIRANGKNIHFDSVQKVKLDDPSKSKHSFSEHPIQYVHIPYNYEVTGLKHQDFAEDMLIVKFQQGVKLLKLNKNYRLPQYDLESDAQFCGQPAFDFLASYPASNSIIKDACFNTSQNSLGILSNDIQRMEIKLYDMMRSQRCYKLISETLQDDSRMSRSIGINNGLDRKRSLRSFVPAKLAFETPRQIENDPSHMVNMIVTTTNRVSLIDPRSDSLKHIFVDRYKLSHVFGTERFIKMEFSKRNNYQFYLLSNMKLRVFDRRFLSQQMNSLEHLLDVVEIDEMNMKVIDLDPLETICMSSRGQLGFVTFDQSRRSISENLGPLLNPKSIHPPFVEPSPMSVNEESSSELYGLSVTTESVFQDEQISFSIAQCRMNGGINVRGFQRPRYQDSSHELFNQSIIREMHFYDSSCELERRSIPDCRASLTRVRVRKTEEFDYIDILNNISPSEIEGKLTSKRALEKYRQMRSKLQRTL